MLRDAVVAAVLCAEVAFAVPVRGQELIDLETVESAIVDQVSRADQKLRDLPPPRYRIENFVIELHISEEKKIEGGVQIKIPLLVSAKIGPAYEQISTIVRTYTYVPRDEITVTAPLALNLEDDILALQASLKSDLLAKRAFIKSKMSKQLSLLIARTAEGRLSFFEAVDVGGDLSTKNVHNVTVNFCLADADGECAK